MSGSGRASIAWFAQRVEAAGLEEARRLGDALGLEVLASSDQLVMLRGAHGEVVEFCGPGHPVPAHLFAVQSSVIGYAVEHLEQTAERLREAGFAPCAEIVEAGEVRFQHFAGVEDRVVGLIELTSKGG